jgi:RNA polymerase sigma-70 factor (ECF subfamily)
MAAREPLPKQPDAMRSVDGDVHESILLSQVAVESPEALSELFAIYHPKLFKFVFKLTRSYAISQQLVYDVMFLVWQKAASFRGDSKVSTWIFGIAYRQTMRRVSRNRIRVVPDSVTANIAADDDTAIETEDLVRHALRSLPAAQQMTVELVFFLGLSYEETAAVSDCPINTVKTRMFYARRNLKKLLHDAVYPTNFKEKPPHE